jgi:uncharacterized repeat protein (TIGR04052 family)
MQVRNKGALHRSLRAMGAAASLWGAAVLAQTTPPDSAPMAVNLQFAALINGQPFECGKSYANVGSTQASLTPTDLRLYVSEVALVNAQGEVVPVKLTQDGIWQLDNIAFLDFENGAGPCRNGTAAVNTTVRGTVPAGQYRSLKFTMGLPFAHNHGDATQAAPPLNNSAMFWSWQGGYRFIKFDATSKSAPGASDVQDAAFVAASGFAVHVGSTQCASASATTAPTACKNPNRMVLQFDNYDPAKSIVAMDVGALLAGTNVTVNARRTSPGCMSFEKDADCNAVMAAMGLPYDGQAAPAQQKFFSLR